MPYSVTMRDLAGVPRVEDIKFRNMAGGARDFGYEIRLGDKLLGTTVRLRRGSGWDAFSHYRLDLDPEDPERQEADRMRAVDGFRTRLDAAEFLLQHWGYR